MWRALMLACLASIGQSRYHNSRIPAEELYQGAMTGEKRTDYACRYYYYDTCYCCGHVLTYVEHGDVCTKFCYEEERSGGRQAYGQTAVIVLPLEIGGPERIRLEDAAGSEKNTFDLNTDVLGIGTTSSTTDKPFSTTTTSPSTTNKPSSTTTTSPSTTDKPSSTTTTSPSTTNKPSSTTTTSPSTTDKATTVTSITPRTTYRPSSTTYKPTSPIYKTPSSTFKPSTEKTTQAPQTTSSLEQGSVKADSLRGEDDQQAAKRPSRMLNRKSRVIFPDD